LSEFTQVMVPSLATLEIDLIKVKGIRKPLGSTRCAVTKVFEKKWPSKSLKGNIILYL